MKSELLTNFTETCNFCFQQVHRRKGHLKRIKRTLVCYNAARTSRILNKRTTVNRDSNGARNIGLIRFSFLISSDSKLLPLFPKKSIQTGAIFYRVTHIYYSLFTFPADLICLYNLKSFFLQDCLLRY